MEPKIEDAVRRLTEQLPLLARQQQLESRLVEVHREILSSLATRGRSLTQSELEKRLGGKEAVAHAVRRLGKADLVVLDVSAERIVGAYPMTTEETPHRLQVNGQSINAMCALDALSVGPMYDAEVIIDSRCHVTAEPIHIRQKGKAIVDSQPTDPRVGVRWQDPTGCAAHSMCTEMVFLNDPVTANHWQAIDPQSISLFTLPEAVEFGARFFVPLLGVWRSTETDIGQSS